MIASVRVWIILARDDDHLSAATHTYIALSVLISVSLGNRVPAETMHAGYNQVSLPCPLVRRVPQGRSGKHGRNGSCYAHIRILFGRSAVGDSIGLIGHHYIAPVVLHVTAEAWRA
jgi:hypothetical protein